MNAAIPAALSFLVVLVSLACGSAGSSSQGPAREESAWYSGGTLHASKMTEWSRAPDADRLATSADFSTRMMQIDGTTIPPIGQLRITAEKLERCISAANQDGVADSQDVATVAATCWILLKQQ